MVKEDGAVLNRLELYGSDHNLRKLSYFMGTVAVLKINDLTLLMLLLLLLIAKFLVCLFSCYILFFVYDLIINND